MPVTRCICHNISFEEIKRIADEKGLKTAEEIQTERLSSTNCKLCLPYIELMLKTGATTFPVVTRTERIP